MKRIIAAFVAVVLFTATFVPTLSVYAQTTLVIDGVSRDFDSQNVGGTDMLPLRAVFEALDFSVAWDDGLITLTRGSDVVTLNLGSAAFTVNGEAGTLAMPVQILVDGSAFAPVNAILAALGHEVEGAVAAVEPPAPAIAAEVITVTVDGYIGPITVAVSLDGTTVVGVEITDHSETPPFFAMAEPATSDAIVAAGTYAGISAADIASGATVTSQAILDAVRQAIEQAGGVADAPAPAPEEPPQVAVPLPADVPPAATGDVTLGANNLPISTATFTAGTFRSEPVGGAPDTPEQAAWQEATGMGATGWRRGPMVVEVDFSENQILDIRLVSHGESAYGAMYLFRAYPMVPDHILVQQSTLNTRINRAEGQGAGTGAVDVFTGATATQASIVLGVEDAIRQAGADPDDLVPQISSTPLPGDRFIPGSHTVYVPADAYVFNFNTNQFIPVEEFADWPTETTTAAPFRSSTVDGIGRVLFNSTIHARMNAMHAPSLFDSERAGTAPDGSSNILVEGAVNNIAREMGFDPTQNPFYRGPDTPVGLWLTVNFGRNYFQLTEHGSGDGLGTAGSGGAARPFSGDSQAGHRDGSGYGTAAIGNTGIQGSSSSQGLGGYWWIQGAHRSVNDRQSTLHLTADIYTSATQSMMGVRHGVEQAIRLAGGNPAELTPRAHGNSPFWREPGMDAGLNLVPGRHVINIPGFDIQMAVQLDRIAIRYLAFINPENGSHISHAVAAAETDTPNDIALLQMEIMAGIGVENWNPWEWAPQVGGQNQEDRVGFRDRLLFGFVDGDRVASALEVDVMPSAPEFSAAIIEA